MGCARAVPGRCADGSDPDRTRLRLALDRDGRRDARRLVSGRDASYYRQSFAVGMGFFFGVSSLMAAQGDVDGDGIGDVCDAACAGESCAQGRAVRWPALEPAERQCLQRVGRVTGLLVQAALEADVRCLGAPSCSAAAALWRQTLGRARKMLARCDTATLEAVGMCASTVDGLVARTPGEGCLSAAAVAAVRSMASARRDGPPATAPRSYGRKLDKAMARYAKQRHQRVARCRDQLLRGVVLHHPDAAPLASPKACDREANVVAALARACDPAALADLGLCGGRVAPTLDALVSRDGTAGCLVSSHRSAIDRVHAVELGTTVGTPEVSATSVRPRSAPMRPGVRVSTTGIALSGRVSQSSADAFSIPSCARASRSRPWVALPIRGSSEASVSPLSAVRP